MKNILEIFRLENKKVREQLEQMLPLYHDVIHGGNQEEKGRFVASLRKLQNLDIHYKRKEHYLFPYLEEHDVTAPTKVMWHLDNQIRQNLCYVIKLVMVEENLDLENTYEQLVRVIEDMIDKEETMLFPLAEKVLRDADWTQLRKESEHLGTYMEPLKDKNIRQGSIMETLASLSGDEKVLGLLPFEVIMTDKDGVIVKYTKGIDPVLDRSKAILGKHLTHIYPPKTAKNIEKLLEEFKLGQKEREDFWVKINDTMVMMRYFTLYDEQGQFNGVLEVVQNIHGIRQLKGEKTILTRVTA